MSYYLLLLLLLLPMVRSEDGNVLDTETLKRMQESQITLQNTPNSQIKISQPSLNINNKEADRKVKQVNQEMKKKKRTKIVLFRDIKRINRELRSKGKSMSLQELKKREKSINKWVKTQMKVFKTWHRKASAKVKSLIEQRKVIWEKNDQMNRMENEKIYQTMLITEIKKINRLKKGFGLMIFIQQRLSDLISDLQNKLLLVASINLMTSHLNCEVKKIEKRYRVNKDGEYYEEIRKMDSQFEKEFVENEKLAGGGSTEDE